MTAVNSVENSYKPRLFLKLAGLAVGAFLTVVIGGIILNVFSTLIEQQKSDAEIRALPSTFAIDPKLEGDLAKVMNADTSQNLADIKDPFVDQSGISQNGNTPATSATTAQTASAKTTVSNNTTAANSPTKISTIQTGGKIQPTSGVGAVVVEKEDTLARILKRDERIRAGYDAGPESAVFAIEDLLPVGVVSGGEGQEEILFYSQSADRTFSYPVGTQFFDGWLVGVKPEGAVFTFIESKETRLKSWVRSIKPRSATVSAMDSPNQNPTGGN